MVARDVVAAIHHKMNTLTMCLPTAGDYRKYCQFLVLLFPRQAVVRYKDPVLLRCASQNSVAVHFSASSRVGGQVVGFRGIKIYMIGETL